MSAASAWPASTATIRFRFRCNSRWISWRSRWPPVHALPRCGRRHRRGQPGGRADQAAGGIDPGPRGPRRSGPIQRTVRPRYAPLSAAHPGGEHRRCWHQGPAGRRRGPSRPDRRRPRQPLRERRADSGRRAALLPRLRGDRHPGPAGRGRGGRRPGGCGPARPPEPLFFLDHVAPGTLAPPVVAEVVAGMADALRRVNCALLGGETAEMPGLYQPATYDIAGFMVGVCERDAIIDGTSIRVGDALLALPSTGLHTNGYSLARRVIPSRALTQTIPGTDETVLDALLAPHRAYLDPVRRLREAVEIKGLAHITGGGIVGNLPRILPVGLGARLQRGAWPEPAIFSYLAPFTPDEEMWRTFNMGIGMIVVVDEASAATALRILDGEVFVVGDIVASEQRRVQILE